MAHGVPPMAKTMMQGRPKTAARPTQGRLAGIILRPQPKSLSNLCFGGPRLDILYVTCGDKVYCRKTKATGVSNLAN